MSASFDNSGTFFNCAVGDGAARVPKVNVGVVHGNVTQTGSSAVPTYSVGVVKGSMVQTFSAGNPTPQFRATGTVVIDGKEYTGNVVTIVGNKVVVDGKEAGSVGEPSERRPVAVTITGDAKGPVEVTLGSVTVNGSAGQVATQSGTVRVRGDVNGSVRTLSGSAAPTTSDAAGVLSGLFLFFFGLKRH